MKTWKIKIRKVSAAVAMGAMVFAAADATVAATINWGAAFELISLSDLDLSKPFIRGANGGNDAGVVVGGVTFDNYESPAFGAVTLEPLWLTSASDGAALNSFSQTDIDLYDPATGDAGLDTLLATTTFTDGPTVTYTLNGLTVGQDYQIQITGQADSRPGFLNQVTDIDGGDGGGGVSVHRYTDLDLDTVPHVTTAIGTFTADAATQTFTAGGPSAGFSALVVSSDDGPFGIPEPSTLVMVGLATVVATMIRYRPC